MCIETKLLRSDFSDISDVGGEYSASSSMPSITASTNSHLQQATAEPSTAAASQAAPIQHAVNSNQNSQADRAAKAPQVKSSTTILSSF